MKGVNKRVVEFEKPDDPYIERIYVVLRGNENVRVSTARAEAEKYVAGLVCWRPRFWPAGKEGVRPLLGIFVAACVLGGSVWAVLSLALH